MGYGPGIFGGFSQVIGALVGALLGFFIFLVAVALIFLLVRYLLAATKAAHIYIAKNSPTAAPRATPPASGSAGAAYAPHTTVAAPAAAVVPPVAKPATKPRTPKPPTA